MSTLPSLATSTTPGSDRQAWAWAALPWATSAVFDAVSDLRKPMDLPLWLGANRSHAQWHGEDLQRRHSGKSTVLCRE